MVRIAEDCFTLTALPGGTVREELHITSDAGERIEGRLLSDHIRIIPELKSFAGRRMVLRFAVDLTGLGSGETVEGSLVVVTDGGEFSVPVSVEVGGGTKRSPGGLTTLAAFAERAERDPDEAFALFLSPDFEKLIRTDAAAQLPEGVEDPKERIAALHYRVAETGIEPVRGDSRLLCRDDRRTGRLIALYRGLAVPGCTRTAMEEFLLACGLKREVEVRLGRTETVLGGLASSVMEELTLKRSGWGSFRIEAEADGDFLVLPQQVITEEDFVGNTCLFRYEIRRERLGRGLRHGRILFHMPDGVRTFSVSASTGEVRTSVREAEADRREAELAELFLARFLGRSDDRKMEEAAGPVLRSLRKLRPEQEERWTLCQALLCVQSNRHSEACALLAGLGERRSAGELGMFRSYLELRTGLLGMKQEEFTLRLSSMQERRRSSILLLVLCLYAIPEYQRFPKRRLKLLRSAFEGGCRSPLLYALVLREFENDDTRLVRLDGLSRQVLLFAARRGLLTERLLLRAAYHADGEKRYSPVLFRILKAGYERFPLSGVLEAVVRLLMKGDVGEACFPWFEQAVLQGSRIIRLYEYYVETLPESKTESLPPVILKYFLYNNTLTDRNKAVLYSRIIRGREEAPEVFEAYRAQMADFAKRALWLGQISEELAVLYRYLITEPEAGLPAETLTKAAFTERLCCFDPEMRRVAVVQPALSGERVTALSDGRALISRASEDSAVLLEDRRGRRYAASGRASLKPLLDVGTIRDLCRRNCPEMPEILLCDTEEIMRTGREDEASFKTWLSAAALPDFSEEFREEARRWVLHFISLHPEQSIFTAETGMDVLRPYARADRMTLLSLLMRDGLTAQAYRIVREFGAEGADPAVMASLAETLLAQKGDREDRRLLYFAFLVFQRGAAKEKVLRYLSRFYEGSLERMLAVREACFMKALPTKQLDERILERLLFTGSRHEAGPAVFGSYREEGGRPTVLHDYLDFYAGAVLGRDVHIDGGLAAYVDELTAGGQPVDFAAKLLYLRYVSQRTEPNARELQLTERFLEESMKRGLRFAFFQRLPERFVRMYRLEDRVFIEQTAEPDAAVWLSYRFGREERMRTVPLPRRFRNLFSKEFTLFYGETLTYKLVIEEGGTRTETEERTIRSSCVDFAGRSSYQRLNRMLETRKRQDYASLGEQLGQYRSARAQAEKLFKIKGGRDLL